MRWLAFVHPAVMATVLGLGLWVLREGLLVRRGRLLGQRADSRRHRRLARTFVASVALGYPLGLVSLGLLRSEPVFASLHSIFASGALCGLVGAYLLGRRLERRPTPLCRTVHLICGSVGLLLALAAGVAGIAILP